MQFLYKAFAAEKLDDQGQTLLPGYPAERGIMKLQPGDRVQIQLADGSPVQASIVATKLVHFAEPTASRLRAKQGFYCAVVLGSEVEVPGIALGVDVHAL